MSTPEGTPPRLPAPEDVQAIFDRAATAAQRAETAADRLEAARGGAEAETRTRWPDMPKEVVDQITKATADQVVAALNAQYELGGSSVGPLAAGAGSSGGSGTTEGTGTAGDTGPPPPGAPGADPPPADGPRNLAHRILGY